MALTSIKQVSQLDKGFVLAPERYDPRRTTEPRGFNESADIGTKLGHLGFLVKEILLPEKADPGMRYIVFDTGDAKNGVIASIKEPGDRTSIGSAKKIIRPGDVLISRLRSYLRQVAWVDTAITGRWNSEDILVAVSTEFYVIRPATNESIAFLVPFLLSDSIQEVLAAAQEGGHHPRFPEKVLIDLIIPKEVVDARGELSRTIEAAVTATRSAGLEMMKATCFVEEIVAQQSHAI